MLNREQTRGHKIYGYNVVTGEFVALPTETHGVLTTAPEDKLRIGLCQKFSLAGELPTVASGGGTFDIVISVPPGGHIHLEDFTFILTTAPGKLRIYEGTTVSSYGDNLTAYCVNREKGSGVSLDSSIYKASSISDDGILLEPFQITGSKQEGGALAAPGRLAWILKPDTDYLIRYTNTSTSDAEGTYVFHFFEIPV